MNLQMVDLRGQYLRIKDEVDAAMQAVVDTTAFIRGPAVTEFEQALAMYLGARAVHGVANGTDALQVALMAVGVGPGDEVITPSFTFVATAEAAALLGAVPVFADIDPTTFNIDPAAVEALVTPRTRAIVPVHLFGQPAAMDALLEIGARHGIPVIEDNAQGIGSTYRGRKTGTLGQVGTLSFFPSKNLGCYGDGGAVITMETGLYERMKLIANHGSTRKYRNEAVGVNSRLDSLQAAVLGAKLPHLDDYIHARREAADRYDAALGDLPGIQVPFRDPDGLHVFHQYTIRVTSGEGRDGGAARDALAARLKEARIPHAVYYPVPLHRLPVFAPGGDAECRHDDMVHTVLAADEVLSLPMHTELTADQIDIITEPIATFARERAEAGSR